MESPKNVVHPARLTSVIDPAALAWGMLKSDRFVLLPLLALLCVAVFFDSAFEPTDLVPTWSVIILERFSQLTVFSIVVYRWRKRLELTGGPHIHFLRSFWQTLLVGFVLWSGLLLPLLALSYSDDQILMLVATFVATIALVLTLRLFFYYVVIGFLGGTLRQVVPSSRALTLKEFSGPIRSLVGPLAITALLVSLASMPYPDGRSLFWTTLASASESVFWLLSTYTGLAFALLLIDDSSWRSAGLDPYRLQRLQTLELQGRTKAARLLSVPVGIKILLLALLVFLGNVTRQITQPPAATVTLDKLQIDDRVVRVSLKIADPEFKYRGFRPIAFNLAGETGLPVATGLSKASLSPTDDKKLSSLDPVSTPLTLYLEFPVNRSRDDLILLEDLWIWYQMKPLIHLSKEDLEGHPVGTATLNPKTT